MNFNLNNIQDINHYDPNLVNPQMQMPPVQPVFVQNEFDPKFNQPAEPIMPNLSRPPNDFQMKFDANTIQNNQFNPAIHSNVQLGMDPNRFSDLTPQNNTFQNNNNLYNPGFGAQKMNGENAFNPNMGFQNHPVDLNSNQFNQNGNQFNQNQFNQNGNQFNQNGNQCNPNNINQFDQNGNQFNPNGNQCNPNNINQFNQNQFNQGPNDMTNPMCEDTEFDAFSLKGYLIFTINIIYIYKKL